MSTELEQLIAEQAKDMRSGDRVYSLSYDAWESGADLVYRYSRKLATDPRHGTLNCYTNLRCRCTKCRAASAQAKREQRRRKHVDKGPFTYQLCCKDCGSHNVSRRRVYVQG